MEHIEKAAAAGIERIFDYGLAMTVMVLAAICAVALVRYLLNRCDQRFDQSLQQHSAMTARVTDVVEKNTVAYVESTAALREVKDAIKDMRRGA